MALERWSLDRLLMCIGGAILLAVFLPVGIYVTYSVSTKQEQALAGHGMTITRDLARELVDPLLVDDRLALHDALRKVAKANTRVHYICIENTDREVIAHTFATGAPLALVEFWEKNRGQTMRLRTDDGPILDISIPVLTPDLGLLHVGLRRIEVVQATRRLGWIMGVALMGTVIVFLTGVHFVAARVSLPLRQLEERVSLFPEKGLIGGDESISGTREVASLARGFAEMSDRLDLLKQERTATQERMIHAERLAALGELAAGLAHEIHNPLDGMSECLRYMESKPHDASLTAKYYPMLKEGLERIGTVMQGMLTFARSGREVSMEALPLTDVVKSLRLLVQPRLEGHRVRLTWETPGSCICLCDSQGLLQAALNLVLNGAEAAEENADPEIRIEASCDSEWVYLIVEDSGPGVPEELREEIFRPFFTTKPVGKGTGLGLSVSREIILAAGGNLELSPEAGTLRGARFVIRLSKLSCEEDQHG